MLSLLTLRRYTFENIMGKEENASNLYCLLFAKCFLPLNPFPDNNFYTLPNWKSLQTTILNSMIIAESSPKGYKTLWEKEKLLITSNFSFSHSVFKRLVCRACLGKG